MSESSIAGKTALVTGGARGIGRACCLRLARAGLHVAVHYRSSEEEAIRTVEAVRALGVKAESFRADVADAAQVQNMIADVESNLGPVDVLVNNAGIFDFVSHEETTPEIWQRSLDINLTGTYNVIWAVKSGMIERRYGRIVNVSSISALRARPMSIAYAVSKAGMVALTKGLSEALASFNIRINAVAPGLIESDILDGVDQDKLDAIIGATPMQRIGQPDEIANLVHFLASDESSFMTGQTIVASGGRVLLP